MKVNHAISSAILILSTVFLPGCSKDDTPFDEKSRAVIEGWIDSDGYPRVIFTAAFIPGNGNVTVADNLIRWGVVTISDGTTTEVMTGGPDKDMFPPFSYYTYNMIGTPGKTYTIEAEYGGIHARAEVTMPAPPVIKDVESARIAGTDTLREATVIVTAPADCPAYYHISTMVAGEDTRFLPSILGAYATDTPGAEISMPVYRGKTSVSTDEFVPQLPTNRRVKIRVERVTREIYDFWKAFNEATLFGGSQFVGHAASLPSNIEGGFGYWSAQGVEIVTLEPED